MFLFSWLSLRFYCAVSSSCYCGPKNIYISNPAWWLEINVCARRKERFFPVVSMARNCICCQRVAYCDETPAIICFFWGLGASQRVSVKCAGHGAGNDGLLNLRFATLRIIRTGLSPPADVRACWSDGWVARPLRKSFQICMHGGYGGRGGKFRGVHTALRPNRPQSL